MSFNPNNDGADVLMLLSSIVKLDWDFGLLWFMFTLYVVCFFLIAVAVWAAVDSEIDLSFKSLPIAWGKSTAFALKCSSVCSFHEI